MTAEKLHLPDEALVRLALRVGVVENLESYAVRVVSRRCSPDSQGLGKVLPVVA
jgi:hypothetical protein